MPRNAAEAPGENVQGAQPNTPVVSSDASDTVPQSAAVDILRYAGVPESVVSALETRSASATESVPVMGSEPADNPKGEEVAQPQGREEANPQEDEPAPQIEGEAQPEPEGVPEGEVVGLETPPNDEPNEEAEPDVSKQPAWIQKRLAKAARQKDRLQDQIDDLTEQLKGKPAADPQTVAPGMQDALRKVSNMTELQKVVEAQRQVRDWCMDNPEGMVLNQGTPNERTIPPEEVRRTLIGATRIIEDAPTRAEELRTEAQIHALVAEQWPELYDKSSDVYKTAQSFLQQNPGLANNPNRDFILGLMWEGWKPFQARMATKSGSGAQQGSNGNGNGATPTPPATPASNVPEALKRKIPPIPKTAAPNPPRGSRVPTPANDAAAAVDRIVKTGATPESIQDAIAAIERQDAVSSGTRRTAAPV